MATTEVLLVKPVEGLGGEGDQVKVRAGYARNFLLPRKIAVTLNASNKKHVEALKKRRAEREQTELSSAQELGKKLEKTSLAFAVKTLGKHTVKIKLHTDVTVELGFDVVSENPIEPAAVEAAPAGDKTEKKSDRRPRKDAKE